MGVPWIWGPGEAAPLAPPQVRAWNDVVDVQQKIGGFAAPPQYEQRGVGAGCGEPNSGGEGGEAVEPSSRCLLKAVQRLGEPTDMITASGIDEAGRLISVDLLIKNPVEESVFHV